MVDEAEPGSPVSEVMIDPVTVRESDAVADLHVVPVQPTGAPLPVVDAGGRLIGLVDPA